MAPVFMHEAAHYLQYLIKIRRLYSFNYIYPRFIFFFLIPNTHLHSFAFRSPSLSVSKNMEMATTHHSFQPKPENFEFPFPTNLDWSSPSCFSANYKYCTLDNWQNEFSPEENFFVDVPLMSDLPTSEILRQPTMDMESINSTQTQESWLGGCGGSGINWSELGALFDAPRPETLPLCGIAKPKNVEESENEEEKKKNKRIRLSDENSSNSSSSSSKLLSRKTISHFFYMPITQAAKELNIGLTLLKKRCRELGIRRWPHRKLMSLQTLIKNVQEMQKEEGEGSEMKLREAIDVLEREKMLLEEAPDLELEDKTKRLRQACFKANYKKRKTMNMVALASVSFEYE